MDLNHHSGALSACLCLGYQLNGPERLGIIAFWAICPTRMAPSLLPGNQYSMAKSGNPTTSSKNNPAVKLMAPRRRQSLGNDG